MVRRLVPALLIAVVCISAGCESKAPPSAPVDQPALPGAAPAPADVPGGVVPGRLPPQPGPVAFAVASATDDDPAAAAKKAAMQAVAGLRCPAKGLIFYEYFPKTIKDAEGNDKEIPDTEKEKAVLPALRSVAGTMPVIGCRARSLTSEGTRLKDTVAVLALGGEALSCKVAKAELVQDRKAVGQAIAQGLGNVEDLKLVIALSEMNLSFDTAEGVSVEDFIRGIVETAGEEVTLFGGNCMPNDYPTDKGGVQFLNDETLVGHVVAMGIGGPIAVHANHTNEILESAGAGITQSLAQAGDAKPLLALLSNCCARGARLREFRQGDECEIQGAILPVVENQESDVPIFGFYAWGELGPIAGPFGGLRCMYQQHTFVSAVLTETQ